MAIAVALLFKTFVLEVSKIPSGSMQPTLMGSPAAGVNDRVLVDKLSFAFRDPRRFEIVVFKHPLERSRVMVKRLVGMPEEAKEHRLKHVFRVGGIPRDAVGGSKHAIVVCREQLFEVDQIGGHCTPILEDGRWWDGLGSNPPSARETRSVCHSLHSGYPHGK